MQHFSYTKESPWQFNVEMLQVFYALFLMQLHLKKCIVYDFIYKNIYREIFLTLNIAHS
jgi:hypothetical protein